MHPSGRILKLSGYRKLALRRNAVVGAQKTGELDA
jgi:hypothetical protein